MEDKFEEVDDITEYIAELTESSVSDLEDNRIERRPEDLFVTPGEMKNGDFRTLDDVEDELN